MHLGLRAQLKQSLAPTIIQAQKVLALSGQGLLDHVQQELLENPCLEAAEDVTERDTERNSYEDVLELSEDRERYDGNNAYDRYHRNGYRDQDGRRSPYHGDKDPKLAAMLNVPSGPRTQAETLIEQLALLELDARERSLAEYLIQSLNHLGWLETPLEEIAESCDESGVTPAELEKILAVLREVIHPSLGARDLRQSLLLQLDAHKVEAPLVRTLIEAHLKGLTVCDLSRVAEATERSIEEIEDALEEIRSLDPHPLLDHDGVEAAAIQPDVVVKAVGDRHEVRVQSGRLPELRISRDFERLRAEACRGDGLRDFVNQGHARARGLIDAILLRKTTLERIVERVLDHQSAFLAIGPAAIVSLRMQQVADELGLDLSTVSRGAADKYVQTPYGIFPLRMFFPAGGVTTESGQTETPAGVQRWIQALVEEEDERDPLSDDRLRKELARRHGVRIARRTVTKYREQLGIGSSRARRKR